MDAVQGFTRTSILTFTAHVVLEYYMQNKDTMPETELESAKVRNIGSSNSRSKVFVVGGPISAYMSSNYSRNV